jgi:hypothetical protein
MYFARTGSISSLTTSVRVTCSCRPSSWERGLPRITQRRRPRGRKTFASRGFRQRTDQRRAPAYRPLLVQGMSSWPIPIPTTGPLRDHAARQVCLSKLPKVPTIATHEPVRLRDLFERRQLPVPTTHDHLLLHRYITSLHRSITLTSTHQFTISEPVGLPVTCNCTNNPTITKLTAQPVGSPPELVPIVFLTV